MNDRRKIQWIVALTVFFAFISGLTLLVFFQVSPDKSRRFLTDLQHHSGYFLTVAICILVGVIILVDMVFRLFIVPLNKLVEEISLIGMANSRHRIKVDGGLLFRGLVQAINAIAVRFEAIQKYDQEKIQNIKAEVEKERNILAAILAELPEGVLVCNATGRILLYNQQAKQFLSQYAGAAFEGKQPETQSDAFVGLGRSIYNVMDKNQIRHALDEVDGKLKCNETNVVAYFVAVGSAGELLRVEVLPVLDHEKAFTGFILIFQDITRHLQAAGRFEGTLTSLAREIRASSAGIRATIEAILTYPDMDKAQLDRFRKVIHKEAVMLGAIIDKMGIDGNGQRKTEWPLVRTRTSDLLKMIGKKALEKLGAVIRIAESQPEYDIQADMYALTQAILFILIRIREDNGAAEFAGRLERKGNFVHLDLSWSGRPVKIDMLREWGGMLLHIEEERLPFTFKEVMGHHGAEICAYSDPLKNNESSLRLFIPACDDVVSEKTRRVTILSQSRPEFFDFDLFGHVDTLSEVAHCHLTELSYTVFDTETTGLDPGGGDEIISIGAVRIVNGRLLREESFEQLIDPRRSVPSASIRIHGIQPEMLQGRPHIDNVLPRFHRFAADTILVAHNAAFDMRLLQIKEKTTGIQFQNPVLDTLLLSAVVHPAQAVHTLEAIADRLGVSIVGRHTAMGDAIATGKLFLKMIPLLAEKGILTLQEALTASRKTFYARIKY